jgi:hypothetical protein
MLRLAGLDYKSGHLSQCSRCVVGVAHRRLEYSLRLSCCVNPVRSSLEVGKIASVTKAFVLYRLAAIRWNLHSTS